MNGVRIGICGSAGTGKTTLAVALAQHLDIPLLKSKDITNDILIRDGYDYASGVHIEQFLAQSNRQDEMLKKHTEFENANGQFVVDRTVVDLFAYAVVECNFDPEKIEKFYKLCKTYAKTYTHLIFCPWGKRPLLSNNRRTLNPWYQFLIHSVEKVILDEWKLSYKIADGEGETKTELVLAMFPTS